MQVIYERCAAVDVDKDVIAVAIRMPGDGPDGRVTVRRMHKTFYGVLREAAQFTEAYDAVGAVAEAAAGTVAVADPRGRWAAICRSVRSWALTHPHEYALIYGSPVPGTRHR